MEGPSSEMRERLAPEAPRREPPCWLRKVEEACVADVAGAAGRVMGKEPVTGHVGPTLAVAVGLAGGARSLRKAREGCCRPPVGVTVNCGDRRRDGEVAGSGMHLECRTNSVCQCVVCEVVRGYEKFRMVPESSDLNSGPFAEVRNRQVCS